MRERDGPEVRAVVREGAAKPSPEALRSLEAADLIVICPSNPYVSIDPILELEGVTDVLRRAPVVAVSPIVRGSAIKGPLAAMLQTLGGRQPSAAAVLAHYRQLSGEVERASIAGFVVERGDEVDIEPATDADKTRILATDIVMRDVADRARLAREVLSFARSLDAPRSHDQTPQ